MIALLQRAASACVDVDGERVAEIGAGVLAFVCAQPGDDESVADRMLNRILMYRMFPEEAGRMNRSVRDVGGGLLLVPQFTLAADTRAGTRPGFSRALPPAEARVLFEYLCDRARAAHAEVGTGRFGAHMRVGLVNDGPVTFWLEQSPGSTP
jgi:D-tyrosyl-tRNA(Tyr) deacylase